jgi:eukaryotic-like serine/threonine-protein kinase
VSCQHCGQTHAEGVLTCPVTKLALSAPGLVGQQVDRYKIERLLGQGGFGTVFRARHVHTDATVALKLLKKELGADQSMLERFMREAKAAGAVGNDHIVGVLDAGVTDGQPFLALEFLDGWDLKDLVYREGAGDPKRLIAITVQVLNALAAAHARGIVHRDMKPANVFIVKRGEQDFVKLLDFGISKMRQEEATGGLTMTGVAMGTPAYMAPEQFFDARSVDGRSDLYSVAVMLYELLAKRLPFETQSYAELIVKVRTETPPPLATIAPGLPPALCAVVDKGLARDREHRWQTAQQMAEALQAASGPEWVPERTAAPTTAKTFDSASMLMGKTSPPKLATPAAPNGGWSVPGGATPAAVPLAPQSFGPAPAIVQPAAPGPAPVAAAGKNTVWLWLILSVTAVMLMCFGTCGVIAIADKVGRSPPAHPRGHQQVHSDREDDVQESAVPEGPGAQGEQADDQSAEH